MQDSAAGIHFIVADAAGFFNVYSFPGEDLMDDFRKSVGLLYTLPLRKDDGPACSKFRIMALSIFPAAKGIDRVYVSAGLIPFA